MRHQRFKQAQTRKYSANLGCGASPVCVIVGSVMHPDLALHRRNSKRSQMLIRFAYQLVVQRTVTHHPLCSDGAMCVDGAIQIMSNLQNIPGARTWPSRWSSSCVCCSSAQLLRPCGRVCCQPGGEGRCHGRRQALMSRL